MADRWQFRRDAAANWTSANPVLADGEMGIERDTKKFKVGDGTTAWTALAYGGIKGDDGAPGTPGPMNSVFASGAGAASLGTTEAQMGSVTINIVNASSKVLVLARVTLTKDTGTTVRTATVRVRRGTTNAGTQVGNDSVISSAGVASSAYYGNAVVIGEDAPGAAGNVTYSVRALVGAGASTCAFTLEAVELTGAKGDKGDAGAAGSMGAMTINGSAKTAAYTFVLGDAGTCVQFDPATAVDATIPTNASVPFPTGTQLYVRQVGTKAVTLKGDTGVTVNAPNGAATTAKGDWRAAVKIDTNEWDVC